MNQAVHEYHILAIDPGGTTGFARYFPHASGVHLLGSFDSGQIPGGWEGFDDWFTDQRVHYALTLIIEDFVITPGTAKKTRQYDALYIIGNVLARARRNSVPVVKPKPSERKFTTDQKLKALGLYNPTEGGHANDAARHLVKYLVRRFPAVGKALGDNVL
jgi:hypothetical protein